MKTEAEARKKRQKRKEWWRWEDRYPPHARLLELSTPEPNTGCFIWVGALNDSGYGRIKIRNRFRRAHVVAWELANGPVPAGLVLDHKCRVRCCVNPDHLEPVTIGENLRRGRMARANHEN